MLRMSFMWVPIIVALSAYGSVRAEDVTDLFLREGPKGWNAWVEQVRHTEARYRVFVRNFEKGGNRIGQDEILHYYQNGNLRRRSHEKVLPDGQAWQGIGVRRGTEYSFESSQRNQQGLAIEEVNERPSAEVFQQFDTGVSMAFSVENFDLRELVRDPAFSIRRSETVTDPDGMNLVRIHFAYGAGPPDKPRRFESGVVDLAPKLNWAVRRYEVLVQSKKQGLLPRSRETVFGNMDRGFVPISRSVRTYYGDPRKERATGEIVHEYLIFQPCKESSAFFTFEAVGLPDVTRKSRSGKFWLVIINVGLLCLGLGAWLYRKRRQT